MVYLCSLTLHLCPYLASAVRPHLLSRTQRNIRIPYVFGSSPHPHSSAICSEASLVPSSLTPSVFALTPKPWPTLLCNEMQILCFFFFFSWTRDGETQARVLLLTPRFKVSTLLPIKLTIMHADHVDYANSLVWIQSNYRVCLCSLTDLFCSARSSFVGARWSGEFSKVK